MARHKAQLNFFSEMGETESCFRDFGGEISRKTQTSRPLDRHKALHIVMASDRARGSLSLRASAERALAVDDLIRSAARKFGVQIDKIGNAGHRIHLLVQFTSRRGLQQFLRSCFVALAREATSSKRGEHVGRFWSGVPYSRVVERGKDYAFTRRCVELNDIQGVGGLHARAHLADRMALQPWWSQRAVTMD